MKLKVFPPWKESYGKPRQHIKKQRHHFTNKSLYTQSYGVVSSHIWKWELVHKEGWVLKIGAFKLWCSRRLLRVLWTARRSNQSILKEINPEYSLEELMLMLKLKDVTLWLNNINIFSHILMGVISLIVVIISLNTKKSNHYGIYCAMLSCLIMCDLCNPADCSPGSSARGDSPGKNIGVGCHALLQRIFPI